MKRMMNSLAILNQWLILNANGDWERSYGFNIIATSDPGWQIEIDLKDTCLEGVSFQLQEKEIGDMAYFRLSAAQDKLHIFSGVYGLEQAFAVFSEKISEYVDPDFYYKLYHPLLFEGNQIGWIPLNAYVKTIDSLVIAKTDRVSKRDIIPVSNEAFDFSKLPDTFLNNVDLDHLQGYVFRYTLISTAQGHIFLGLIL